MAHPARGSGRQQLVYRRHPADAGRRGGPAQQLIVFATTCPYKGAFQSAFFYEQPPVSSAANRVVLTGNMRFAACVENQASERRSDPKCTPCQTHSHTRKRRMAVAQRRYPSSRPSSSARYTAIPWRWTAFRFTSAVTKLSAWSDPTAPARPPPSI